MTEETPKEEMTPDQVVRALALANANSLAHTNLVRRGFNRRQIEGIIGLSAMLEAPDASQAHALLEGVTQAQISALLKGDETSHEIIKAVQGAAGRYNAWEKTIKVD